MKRALRIVAKGLGAVALIVFFCPAKLFSTSFAPAVLVQIAIAGVLGLIGLTCWHLGDTSGQES
jgi:hypothetical protein